MYEFICQHCGSSKLGYLKYVQSIIPVEIQENGIVYYQQSLIDEEVYTADIGYCCAACGKQILFCGSTLETEKDFIEYLKLSEEQRQEKQTEYNRQDEFRAQYKEEWKEIIKHI